MDCRVFCLAPWHSLAISPAGQQEICCDIRGDDYTRDQIKESFLDQKWPSQCRICKTNEDAGLISSRIEFNSRFTRRDSYHKDFFDLQELHLDLGNLCNNACLTCSPEFSTQIHNKWRNIGWIDKPPQYIKQYQSRAHLDKFSFDEFSTLMSSADNLKRIRFLGGEPLINPKLSQYIDLVPDYIARSCTALICTNGSVYDAELLDKLKKFSKVELTLSIDGFGKLNEFIRDGSNWSTVSDNLTAYHNINQSNLNLIVNITVSVYNMFDIGNLLTWLETMPKINASVTLVHDPKFLSVSIVPDDLKQNCIQHCQQTLKSLSKPRNQMLIKGLIKSLEQGKFDSMSWANCLSYTQQVSDPNKLILVPHLNMIV